MLQAQLVDENRILIAGLIHTPKHRAIKRQLLLTVLLILDSPSYVLK